MLSTLGLVLSLSSLVVIGEVSPANSVVDSLGFESEVFRCAAVGLVVCCTVNLVGRFGNDLAVIGEFETRGDLPVLSSLQRVVTASASRASRRRRLLRWSEFSLGFSFETLFIHWKSSAKRLGGFNHRGRIPVFFIAQHGSSNHSDLTS